MNDDKTGCIELARHATECINDVIGAVEVLQPQGEELSLSLNKLKKYLAC